MPNTAPLAPIDRRSMPPSFEGIDGEIKDAGFAFRSGAEMTAALQSLGPAADWPSFAASWDDMGLDLYMADGGRYRRRRFAAFDISSDAILRKPHQPHYQSRDYNQLNGDIERWFDPVRDNIAEHGFTRHLFGLCRWIFTAAATQTAQAPPWHAEMHQFRIEATPQEAGLPTPEGMHRDGVDWVCVMLVRRQNVQSGTTEIFDNVSEAVNRFTLTEPLDVVFLDDTRVRHGVTPISRLVPDAEGYRDVLVLTFRRDGD